MKKLLLLSFTVTVFIRLNAQDPDTWSLVGAMPPSPDSARIFATAFNIDKAGYIGLGYNGQGHAYHDFWKITYDSAGNNFIWTQVADFPEDRYGATGVGNSTKAYVGFGYDASGLQKNDFWEFDPVANSWTAKPVKPTTSRAFAAGFSIGNNIYIVTGSGLNDVWKYDPSISFWTQKQNFPGGGRQGAVAFSIKNKGYFGTGYGPFEKKDFWEYEPVTDTWTQKTDLEGPARGYAVGFSVGSKGFIGTGQATSPFSDFWEYDPETDTWVEREDYVGVPRASAAGFTDCKKGYLGTGVGPGGYNQVWAYTPSKVSVGKMIVSDFCAEYNYDIPYTSNNDNFTFQNIFSVELSDATGSFSNPLVIGSINSINTHGYIPVIIPNSIMTGLNYRMRITSTHPEAVGSDSRIDYFITSVADPFIWQNGNTLFSAAASGNQWYDVNGPIPGATNQSFFPTETSDYYVVVTENGCESLPSNIISIITGIGENKLVQLSVSPNPSDGIITLSTLLKGNLEIRITDAIGKTVYHSEVSKSSTENTVKLDVRHLAKGSYMLFLKQDNNKAITKILIN